MPSSFLQEVLQLNSWEEAIRTMNPQLFDSTVMIDDQAQITMEKGHRNVSHGFAKIITSCLPTEWVSYIFHRTNVNAAVAITNSRGFPQGSYQLALCTITTGYSCWYCDSKLQ